MKATWLVGLSLLTSACVDERPDAPGSGSGSAQSAIDESWLIGSQVMHLAADDTSLYYAADGVRLTRRALDGGPEEVLFTVTNEDEYIDEIYLGDSDIIFVIEMYDFETSASERRLMRLPKAGGRPLELTKSQDVRAFLGVTVDSTHVYFSTFTSVLRVPLAGGSLEFIGESPSSIRYWAMSPTLRDGHIYWAEDTALYKIAPDDSDNEGTLVVSLPGKTEILGGTDGFVVGLASPFGYLEPYEHFIEVDPTTGNTGPMIAFGAMINEAVVAGDSVFGVAYDGVTRVPREGGAPVQLSTAIAFDVAATSDAVFVGTATGITRMAVD